MRIKFGFRAITEEYSPEHLVEQIKVAEDAGFDFITASDHFHPWFHNNAQAPQAWLVLAAAVSVTKRVELGTGITSPFSRYHPGIVAQSFATLQRLSGGRIFLTVGTGEAMNEIPLGLTWPSYKERVQSLEESIIIIERLWNEEFVTFEGKHYHLASANLYTKPDNPPKLYMAASGPKSARMAGRMTDGLYTFPTPKEHLLNTLLTAFEEGVKESGKSIVNVDKSIELLISYDPDYDKALNQITHWRSTLIPWVLQSGIYDPRILQSEGMKIPLNELKQRWIICTHLEECLPSLQKYIRLGFNRIEIHSSSEDQIVFAKSFAQNLEYMREQTR